MEDKELTKIRTLLHYWIEHNREHSQEFKEWAGKVNAAGETEAGEDMMLAAQGMDKASEMLSRARDRLEGKGG